jgi:hypothetical protein
VEWVAVVSLGAKGLPERLSCSAYDGLCCRRNCGRPSDEPRAADLIDRREDLAVPVAWRHRAPIAPCCAAVFAQRIPLMNPAWYDINRWGRIISFFGAISSELKIFADAGNVEGLGQARVPWHLPRSSSRRRWCAVSTPAGGDQLEMPVAVRLVPGDLDGSDAPLLIYRVVASVLRCLAATRQRGRQRPFLRSQSRPIVGLCRGKCATPARRGPPLTSLLSREPPGYAARIGV